MLSSFQSSLQNSASNIEQSAVATAVQAKTTSLWQSETGKEKQDFGTQVFKQDSAETLQERRKFCVPT